MAGRSRIGISCGSRIGSRAEDPRRHYRVRTSPNCGPIPRPGLDSRKIKQITTSFAKVARSPASIEEITARRRCASVTPGLSESRKGRGARISR